MKKERGIALTTLILIIVAILIIGGISTFFLVKGNDEDTDKEKVESIDKDSTKKDEDNKETQKTTVPEDYIGIYTIDDYKKFFTGEYSLKNNYILMNDLDLSSVQNCTPIGWEINPNYIPAFEGIFDGNHYTISNFTINVPESEMNRTVGFFARIDNGTVKNLKITNAKIISNVRTYDIGVLSGQIENSTIDNCTIKGHIELNGQQSVGNVGFIAGTATGETELNSDNTAEFGTMITNCTVDGKITGNNNYQYGNAIGGAFGQISNGATKGTKAENIIVNLEILSDTISGNGFSCTCSADVSRCGTNVKINTKSEDNVSGFASLIKGARITECYSKGNITAGKYVSGFIHSTATLGYTSDCGIKDCYSNVNITVLTDVNYNTSALFVKTNKDYMENVYATGSINYTNKTEGEKYFIEELKAVPTNAYFNKEQFVILEGNEQYLTGLTTQQMKMKSSYSGFDFENVWDIDEGNSTPYLRWENSN